MNFHRTATSGEESIRGPATESAYLRQEIERLLILNEAMWTLLQKKLGLEDADLIREMVQIDMRDGKLDGKVAATGPEACPACGRTLFKHRPRCLYCGELVPPKPFQR